MIEVIGIQFKKGAKVFYYLPKGEKLEVGQLITLKTQRGYEQGEVVMANTKMKPESLPSPLRELIQVSEEEQKKEKPKTRNLQKEKEALTICQDCVLRHKLEMKLVEAKYLSENKLVFYFTAEGRIDFRNLVKELASIFHARIELRQIGVRDEAKMLGGIGMCGRPFCCSSYLRGFHPVSIKMAKQQGLSLNPTKISGACGRLMCCLKYEQNAYEDLIHNSPRYGMDVKTPDGPGIVKDVNLLTGQCLVQLKDTPEAAPRTFHKKDLQFTISRPAKNTSGKATGKPEKRKKNKKS